MSKPGFVRVTVEVALTSLFVSTMLASQGLIKTNWFVLVGQTVLIMVVYHLLHLVFEVASKKLH